MSLPENKSKKILFVASLWRNHILQFHVPTIQVFVNHGWVVDVACAGEEPVPYVRYRYTMSWKRSPFNPGMIRGIRELKKILDEEYYDVVYCHTPVGGMAARIAARKTRKNGTKVVYCPHGLHFYKGSPVLNWFVYYPVEKWLAGMTDVIFTVNEEDYETAKKHFGKRTAVEQVPEVGVDFGRLVVESPSVVRKQYREEFNIPENAFVMIYVADIVKNKNQVKIRECLLIP